jgi:hypothetical protein
MADVSIKNLEGLSIDQIRDLVDQGGRFVIYKYVISILIMTFQRQSDIIFLRPGESGVKHHIGFTLCSLFLGWWGIPWGIIYTIGALYTNMTGGKDVTFEIMDSIAARYGNRMEGNANTNSPYNIPGQQNASTSQNNSGNPYNIPGQNTGTNTNSGQSASSTSPYNIPK